MITEYEINGEKVFLIRGIIEVRFDKSRYEKLAKRYPKEYIISFSEEKKVLHHTTKRPLVYVSKESGIPLLGHAAFGIIDRGTNLLQVRPITGCNLNCIFCSVDEGKISKTKKTDFIVDPDYLLEELRKVCEFKGKGVEVHIDGQAEPMLYPYMKQLLEGVAEIKEVSVVSMQTNGTLISEKVVEEFEGILDRFNVSISALDQELANKIYGTKYPLKKVLEAAEAIANSKIDLLIAPVWLPGINDEEIPKIIEFALEVGAGKKYPPLGIQKYIPYKGGRKLKDVMSFKEFYEKLRKMEEEYGVKLVLSPKDFGIEKRARYPSPIKRGDVFRGRIICEGRSEGEKIAVVKGRVVTVLTNKGVGEAVKFKIVREKDGILLADETS